MRAKLDLARPIQSVVFEAFPEDLSTVFHTTSSCGPLRGVAGWHFSFVTAVKQGF